MRAHGDCELYQYIDRVYGCGWRSQYARERESFGISRNVGTMLIHYFDLVAFQHSYIHELSQFLTGMVFDDE
jgi:hypothetical protein